METSDNKFYVTIGNEILNLFEVEDQRLYETINSLPKEEFEKIEIPKIKVLEGIQIDIFSINKGKIQGQITNYCIFGSIANLWSLEKHKT